MTSMLTRLKYGSILFGTAIFAYLTLVRPAYEQRGRVLGEIRTLNQRVAQAEDDYGLRDRARRRLANLEARLATETRPIPDSGDVAGVISGISSDIRELELEGAKLNRGRETAFGATASSGLLVETVGRFDLIVELVRRIEALPRLVRISSLSAQNVNPSSGDVKATLGLDAYYRVAAAPEPNAPGK